MTPKYEEFEEKTKVTIEVECECDGVCEHLVAEVQKAMQKSYNDGVRDGATNAMDRITSFLQKHYPKEFAQAEREIFQEQKREKLN
jgi:hypothetical protein